MIQHTVAIHRFTEIWQGVQLSCQQPKCWASHELALRKPSYGCGHQCKLGENLEGQPNHHHSKVHERWAKDACKGFEETF